jgi:hypothetical protein
LWKRLKVVTESLEKLTEKVRDTFMGVGSETLREQPKPMFRERRLSPGSWERRTGSDHARKRKKTRRTKNKIWMSEKNP